VADKSLENPTKDIELGNGMPLANKTVNLTWTNINVAAPAKKDLLGRLTKKVYEEKQGKRIISNGLFQIIK
jgi:hypothetical protein